MNNSLMAYLKVIYKEDAHILKMYIRAFDTAIEDAKTETARRLHAEFRAVAVLAYNLGLYLYGCGMTVEFTETAKGFKLEDRDGPTKYFYTVRALERFVEYNLNAWTAEDLEEIAKEYNEQ